MISRKELQYVSTHTKDVPFPGINYAAEVMENLHAAFKAYEQKYQDKSYNFILSNGEEFTFEILAYPSLLLYNLFAKNRSVPPGSHKYQGEWSQLDQIC